MRLCELGFYRPAWHHFVPVDFEGGAGWLAQLVAAGFDGTAPALFASTGVSMYLHHEANLATLRNLATLPRGTSLIMSFVLPIELVDPADRPAFERAVQGARGAGTPFVSFYAPEQLIALGRSLGFQSVEHLSADALARRYFRERTDGLLPGTAEQLLVFRV